MRRPLLHWFFLLWLIIIPTTALAQSRTVATLQIIEIDQSQFPEMRVRFIAVDADGEAITTLANTDITLRENDQIIDAPSLTTGEPLPDKTAIVLDLGKYSNLDEFNDSALRQYLLSFAGETFRDGIDTLALYAVNPSFPTTTQTLVPLTNSADEYSRAVEQMPFDSTGGATSLDSVEYALEQLLLANEVESGNLAVIYIGSLLDDPLGQLNHARGEAARVGARFSQDGVRFYGLHTQANEYAEPLTTLAEGSPGFYTLFLPTEDNTRITSQIIQDIEAQNPTYQLSFRSTSSADGTRNITVETVGGRASNSQTYAVSVLAPEVRITSPLDEKVFVRDVAENSDGTVSYTLNRFAVEARIANWPDGKPRRVESAELLVDGIVVQTIDNPETDDFQFNVDISDYTNNTTLPLVLRVRDELGLESSSATVNIAIEVPERITQGSNTVATVVATPTLGPTQTPVIQRVGPDITIGACENDYLSPGCMALYIPWIGLALSLIALLVLFTRYRQQMKNVGGRIVAVADNVRKTLLGGATQTAPLATLHILSAKADRMGETYQIFNDLTVLGRDPQYTDLQLFDPNDDSSVSGRHCTIQYEKSLGKFLIIDHSTSGTRVNGQKLERDNPMVLGDGDEITLGLISKSGAKLRFEVGEVTDFVSAETVLDIGFQQQGVDTIFDDVGTKTQFEFGEDDLGDSFEVITPPEEDDIGDDWMRDLE